MDTVTEVFVDTSWGSTFSIEVGYWDTILEIKKKIEKSQGVPVSEQTLYFQGELLTRDDFYAKIYNFFDKSRLQLFLSVNNCQVLQQTEQSPVPSTSIKDIINNIEDSHEKNQDSSVTLHQTENSPVPSNTFEEFLNQDWSKGDDQVVHQTEKSLASSKSIEEFLHDEDWPMITEEMITNNQDSSGINNLLQREPSPLPNSFGDLLFGEDQPLSAEHFNNIQSFLPAGTTEEMIRNKNQVFQTEQSSSVPSNAFGDFMFGEDQPFSNIQSEMINSSQVFQMEPSPPSNSTEQRMINDQDLPVRVGSSNQVVQTEKSPPSNSIKEVINIPDSPVKVRSARKPPQKLRVMMLPYSRESKPVMKFPVEVNASEKVEVLRKELEKIQQRSQINLPEEGYFFIHKQDVLHDDQSFRWNGVAHGDTIEIFPGHVTKDERIQGSDRYYGRR